MILHLILCVFVLLLTTIALGLTIGGLVKKKKKLWIISLSSFVVLSLVSVYALATYAQKSIAYMGSDEFQAETKKTAENWGKNMGNTITGAAEGLEESIDEDAIAKLAEKSGVILGSGVSAITKGVDESIGKQTVYLSEEGENMGIRVGRAELLGDSVKYSFGLFLEFEKNFDGKLKLTAYDIEGKKVDVSEIEVSKDAGHNKVTVFQFDYLKPTQTEYCILTSIPNKE